MSYGLQDLYNIQRFLENSIGNAQSQFDGTQTIWEPLLNDTISNINNYINAGDNFLSTIQNEYNIVESQIFLSGGTNGNFSANINSQLNTTIANAMSYLQLINGEIDAIISSGNNSAPSPTVTTVAPTPTPDTTNNYGLSPDQLTQLLAAVNLGEQNTAKAISEDFVSQSLNESKNTTTSLNSIASTLSNVVGAVTNTISQVTNEAAAAVPASTDLTDAITSNIASWSSGLSSWLTDKIIIPLGTDINRRAKTFFATLGIFLDDNGNWTFSNQTSQLNIPSTTQEIYDYEKNVQETINNPTTIWQVAVSTFIRGSLAITAMGARLEPLLDLVRQAANTQQPTAPISVNDAIDLTYQGIISQEQAEQEALKESVSREDFRALLNKSQLLPSVETATQWLAKSLITQNDYNNIVFKNHGSQEQANLIYNNSFRSVNTGMVQQLYGRMRAINSQWLSQSLNYSVPPELLPLYDKEQIDRTQAEYDWLNHVNLPPAEWFANAYFKGLRPKSDVGMSAIAQNYPDELSDIMLDVMRPVLPARVAVALFAKGAMDEAYLRGVIAKQGFAGEDVDKYVEYAILLREPKSKLARPDLAKLALNAAVDLYENKVINVDQLFSIYEAHGYSADAATLEIEYIDLKHAAQLRKDFADNVVYEVDLGEISLEQGVSTLQSNGYTPYEIVKYEKMMRKARISKIKRPTEAQVKAAFKANYIGIDEVEQYYIDEGFNSDWVQVLTALVVGIDVSGSVAP